MAAMFNSSVLACNYAISGTAMSELNAKMPSSVVAAAGQKVVPAIRAQQARVSADSQKIEGRRAALLFLAATAFTSASAAASNSFADAMVVDDYLEKSKANKELNDKRLARAFAVQFGTCKFPENFTGCQDLANQKKLSFISDGLRLECGGKPKWPELVGQSGEAAVAKIERENPNVRAIVLPEDTLVVTGDFSCGRVRVFVNRNGVVVRTPQIG